MLLPSAARAGTALSQLRAQCKRTIPQVHTACRLVRHDPDIGSWVRVVTADELQPGEECWVLFCKDGSDERHLPSKSAASATRPDSAPDWTPQLPRRHAHAARRVQDRMVAQWGAQVNCMHGGDKQTSAVPQPHPHSGIAGKCQWEPGMHTRTPEQGSAIDDRGRFEWLVFAKGSAGLVNLVRSMSSSGGRAMEISSAELRDGCVLRLVPPFQEQDGGDGDEQTSLAGTESLLRARRPACWQAVSRAAGGRPAKVNVKTDGGSHVLENDDESGTILMTVDVPHYLVLLSRMAGQPRTEADEAAWVGTKAIMSALDTEQCVLVVLPRSHFSTGAPSSPITSTSATAIPSQQSSSSTSMGIDQAAAAATLRRSSRRRRMAGSPRSPRSPTAAATSASYSSPSMEDQMGRSIKTGAVRDGQNSSVSLETATSVSHGKGAESSSVAAENLECICTDLPPIGRSVEVFAVDEGKWYSGTVIDHIAMSQPGSPASDVKVEYKFGTKQKVVSWRDSSTFRLVDSPKAARTPTRTASAPPAAFQEQEKEQDQGQEKRQRRWPDLPSASARIQAKEEHSFLDESLNVTTAGRILGALSRARSKAKLTYQRGSEKDGIQKKSEIPKEVAENAPATFSVEQITAESPTTDLPPGIDPGLDQEASADATCPKFFPIPLQEPHDGAVAAASAQGERHLLPQFAASSADGKSTSSTGHDDGVKQQKQQLKQVRPTRSTFKTPPRARP